MTTVKYDPNKQEAFSKCRVQHQGDASEAGRRVRAIVDGEEFTSIELPAMENGEVHEEEVKVPADRAYRVKYVLDEDQNDQEEEDNESEEITYQPEENNGGERRYNQLVGHLAEVRAKGEPPEGAPDYTTPPDGAIIMNGHALLPDSSYVSDDWTNVLRWLKDKGDPSDVTVWIDPAWVASNGGRVRHTKVMGHNAANFTLIGGGALPSDVVFDGDKGNNGSHVRDFDNKLQSFNRDNVKLCNMKWQNARRGNSNSCIIQLGYLDTATLHDMWLYNGHNCMKGSRINRHFEMVRCRVWEGGNRNSSAGTHLVYITGDGKGGALIEDCQFWDGRHYYNLKLRLRGETGPIVIRRTSFDGSDQLGACYENDAAAETTMEDCSFVRKPVQNDDKVISFGTQSERLVNQNLTLIRCTFENPDGDDLRVRTISQTSVLTLVDTSRNGLELKDWGDRIVGP